MSIAHGRTDGVETARAIWITWERHRRTREIASALDLDLYELRVDRGWQRYPRLALATLARLRAVRPTHLFVQCPSVVLAVLCVCLRPLFGYQLIADLHNEAVDPFINRAAWYRQTLLFIQRYADVSLVTNTGLVAPVERNGGKVCILPDRVPQIADHRNAAAVDPKAVAFICSFAPDEPYHAVIEAARSLPAETTVYITGDSRKLPRTAPLPPNVRLTGFLHEDDYERLIRTAAVIVDLTAMENCLVCGAYEAIAVGRPLVTSDTVALRRTFQQGTVFTRHDPPSIAAAIADALQRQATLADEVGPLREQLDADWGVHRSEVLRVLRLRDRAEGLAARCSSTG